MTIKVHQADSIDGVVDQLTAIVEWSENNGAWLGYFAALYRGVTIEVRRGIADGAFDDGERMERFDIVFANRYLEALALHLDGRDPGASWASAFDTLDEYWPIVLQHLLLGMNAHINLDLGIAAAQIVGEGRPEALHADFNRINGILGSMVDSVQNDLALVWAPLRILNRFLGSVDDQIIRFSMDRGRDQAWDLTLRFSSLPREEWPWAIAVADVRALEIARLVRKPGVLLSTVARFVRIGEVGPIGAVVKILSRLR